MPVVYIKADTKDASRNVKRLDRDIDEFARSSARSLQRMEKSFRTLKTLGIGVGGFFSAQIIAGYSKELIRVADTYTNIKSRIDLVTDSTEAYTQAYNQLYQVSRETGTTLENNTQAFVAMNNALKDATDQEIISWLKTLDQGLVVSGSGAEEASRFMQQFNQAMAGGIVRAEEFNSMLENNPYIMNKVADALGKTVGELRNMMLEGELTSEVFTKALTKISDVVEKDFGNMALTVERAWNDLSQVWKRILSDSNEAGGGTNALAEAIADLAATAEEHREEISSVLAGFIEKIPSAIEGVGEISTQLSTLATQVNNLVTDLDTTLGVGWKELGILGLILYGGSKIGLKGGVLGIVGALALIGQKEAERGRGWADVNKLLEEHSENIDKITHKTEKLAAIDWDLEGFFLDIEIADDTYRRQITAIEEELNKFFADLDTAAAQAGEKAGTSLGSKMSKEAKREFEKLQKDLAKDLQSIDEEIFDIQLEIQGDVSGTGVWDAVIQKANEYEQAAKAAIKSGDWQEARENIGLMVDYLDKLPEKIQGAAPTDDQIARQKQMVQYWLKMIETQTSFHAKRQYLKNAQDAQNKLNQLLKEQKEGTSDIVSEESLRLKKLEEMKGVQQLLLELQEKALKQEDPAQKPTIDTASVEQAKESLKQAKVETEAVTTSVNESGEAVVQLGDTWQNMTLETILNLEEQKGAILENIVATKDFIRLLDEARAKTNTLPSTSGSGASTQPSGYAVGGVVPGFGGTDSVIARLTPGEGVLTPLGMNILGAAALSQLNAGQDPTNTGETTDVNFYFNGKSVGTLSGRRHEAARILERFSEMRKSLS